MVRKRSCPAVSHCYHQQKLGCSNIYTTDNLQFHCLALQFNSANLEVDLYHSVAIDISFKALAHSDSRDIALGIGIIGESKQQA